MRVTNIMIFFQARVVHFGESRPQSSPRCPDFEFSPSDIRVPASLAYHLADIYLEELDKVLSNPTSVLPPAPIHTLLKPFLALAAQTPASLTHKRIQSSLFEPLFLALSPKEEQSRSQKRISLMDDGTGAYSNLIANACYEDPKAEGKMDGPLLRKMFLRSLFEVASQPETRDSNRRKMYALWKESNQEDE